MLLEQLAKWQLSKDLRWTIYYLILKLSDLKIAPLGTSGAVLRFKETDEATHQNIIKILAAEAEKNTIQFEERRFSSIGPTIGTELKQKSLKALALA